MIGRKEQPIGVQSSSNCNLPAPKRRELPMNHGEVTLLELFAEVFLDEDQLKVDIRIFNGFRETELA